MDFILAVLAMMGQVIIDSFSSPLFIILYILLFVLISWQYRRVENLSSTIIYSKRRIYFKSALLSTFLGIFGGVIGSVLLVFIGIDLQSVGILPLWIIALGLMLISPRYLCFAYAGGILAIISLVFDYPQISIPQLMGLIAILHMVESVLIMLNGHFNAIPVYVKQGGEMRGGFNLQKFWPLPLIALVSTGIADPGSGVMMPEWWPLLGDYGGLDQSYTYTLLPVLAVLGYGDLTTTRTPGQKANKSALHLLAFSLILLSLSVLASNWTIFLPVVALFSPLGHELVIWLGMKEERSKKPKYINPSIGVGVLHMEAASLAARAGLKAGDIILSLNKAVVNDQREVQELVSEAVNNVVFEIKRDQQIVHLTAKKYPDDELGIIFVPDGRVKRYLTVKEDSWFDLWRRHFKSKG